MSRYMDTAQNEGRRAIILLAAALAAAAAFLCLAGCGPTARHVGATAGSKSAPYSEFLEDPVTLATVRTIAVLPFENRSAQPGFDPDLFAIKLANHLAAGGAVRVLYPKDILDFAEQENRAVVRHNAQLRERIRLGIDIPEGVDPYVDPEDLPEELRPRAFYNPPKNPEEAVKLARRIKADAVIVGTVADFDPYARPRMVVTMQLMATGNSESQAMQLAELTQWGIPLVSRGGQGVVYMRQKNYDATFGNVGLEVTKYGFAHHTDMHPMGNDVYLRSSPHYYNVVASDMAKAVLKVRADAVKEAEARAREEARRRGQDQAEAMRRIAWLMERDSRIPDYETDLIGPEYFDQGFPDPHAVVAVNGGDKRVMSHRPEGRSIRPPTVEERVTWDMRDSPGAGLPNADRVMETNSLDTRDRTWRPDVYNFENPAKAVPLYDIREAGRNDYQ